MKNDRPTGPLCVALAIASCSASVAYAHHSPAAYDQSVTIVIEGTVVELSWLNPHSYLTVEATGSDGRPVLQRIELGPPAAMGTWGVTPGLLSEGERVTVRAFPHRGGANRIALGLEIVKQDGTVFAVHPRTARGLAASEARATGIAGTWVGEAPQFMGLAAAMASWPLTEKGRQAKVANKGALDAALASCTAAGAPMLMLYPVVNTVTVDARAVVFDIDWMDTRRTVHVDGRGHPEDLAPTPLGHSVGRWEGDALVVDTIGFTDHPTGFGFELPSSSAKHTVERFEVNADGRHLDYTITIEDPEYLAAPVTHRAQWLYRPDLAPSGMPCDLDVARRFIEEE